MASILECAWRVYGQILNIIAKISFQCFLAKDEDLEKYTLLRSWLRVNDGRV